MAVLWIDPAEVAAYTNDLSLYLGSGRILAGEWDRRGHSLQNYWIHRGLHQRFDEGLAWEDTAYVDVAATYFEEGTHFWGYDSLEAFRTHRCQYVDELYESIESEGFRTDNPEDRFPDSDIRRDSYLYNLPVLISVGRGGEKIVCEGKHRLIIGEILDVGEIPVIVLARHERWQAIRERVYAEGRRPEGLADHPDLDWSERETDTW